MREELSSQGGLFLILTGKDRILFESCFGIKCDGRCGTKLFRNVNIYHTVVRIELEKSSRDSIVTEYYLTMSWIYHIRINKTA